MAPVASLRPLSEIIPQALPNNLESTDFWAPVFLIIQPHSLATSVITMRITLTITRSDSGVDDPDLLLLEVFPDMTLETLRSSIQAETRIEPNVQHLYHNGQLITDNTKTLEELRIGDGEMLALHVRDVRARAGAAAASTSAQPPANSQERGRVQHGQQDPELIRLQILGDPRLREEVSRTQPHLARVLEDPVQFAALFSAGAERERQERAARQRELARLNDNPFDVEAQKKIEEMIRQERVTENLQSALEHTPEVFGRVHMLYVNVEVNGYKIKALVDSGAQATIMSPACAEACGMMRLVDRRFAGVARGVGTANIIGRVHWSQIKIGPLFLMCSFTVMEGKSVGMLLGLDMLRRHQACIDLSKDKLVIQGEEIPFLSEAEAPKDAEELEEPQFSGPSGATIGGRSGAVSVPSSAPRAVASPQAAAPAQQSPGQPSFPREHIEALKNLGATEERAIRLLEATGGNLDLAAGMIFDD